MKLSHILLSISTLVLFTFAGLAQDVSEGQRTFTKKVNGNALSIVIQGQPKNVSTVMDQMFRKATASKPKLKGKMKMYEGVHHGDISNGRLDLYYMVEKASKNNKNTSRVSFFLSSGNMNFMSSENFPSEMANATEILQGLEYEVKIYEMELAIKDQEKIVEKAIKVQEKLEKDSLNLEAKLAETIQAIEDNKVSRANQIRTIEEEETNLMSFREQLENAKAEAVDAAVARRESRASNEAARTAAPVDEGKKKEDDKKDENNK